MRARATVAQFQPGTTDEAISILRDVMLPKAKEQHGFKGALILRDTDNDSGIVITLWETEEDLLESSPPEDIIADVERLGELMIDSSTQHTYDVDLRI